MPYNLWVFGDSFSTVSPENLGYNTWPELVAKELQVDQYINHADHGVSNDYIFYQLTSHAANMQAGDYVIIQLTNKNRQWFFENQHHLANFHILDFEKQVTNDQEHAVKEYIKHLQNDSLDDIRYTQLILSLMYISNSARHLRILILPGFTEIDGINGTLMEVCDKEFKSVSIVNKWYKEQGYIDSRINHMSKNNHAILAEKIISFFKTGKTIDLKTGFEQEFLE